MFNKMMDGSVFVKIQNRGSTKILGLGLVDHSLVERLDTHVQLYLTGLMKGCLIANVR